MFDKLKIGLVGAGQTGTAIPSEILKVFPNTTIYSTDINPNLEKAFYTQLRTLGVANLDNVHHIGPLSDTAFHEGMKDLDLVQLAVPGSQQPDAIARIAPYLSPKTIITDVCSAKQSSIDRILPAIAGLPFPVTYVPFHILNGFAGDGPLSAKPDILKAPGVIVPGIATAAAQDFVATYLTALGTKLHFIEAPKHDEVLSTTSQHEYVSMFAYADCGFIKNMPMGTVDPGRWIQSMLRIIDASPEMWAANFTDCRSWVLKSAKSFRPLLQGIGENIHKADWRIDRAYDYAKLMPSKNTTPFDVMRYDGFDLNESAFAAVLSLAITENIFLAGERTGVDIPVLCNPSAKDGMGCMNDPDMAKYLIRDRRIVLPNMIRHYLASYDRMVNLVADLPANPKREGHIIVDPAFEAVRTCVRSFKPVDHHVKRVLAERPKQLMAPRAQSHNHG